jgi:hypothetical protein
MTEMGHENAFPRPRANGRCRFSEATFVGTRSSDGNAPKPPFVRREEPTGQAESGHSRMP